ncbi:hypothetical protein A5746_01895 [Mycolicibacterium conceptionense]|uniref:hypothetical protein n=1 Tax=Mycolicibacterium TaxID=1866885 RepID=UPI0007EC5014|nr:MULTISPECIES: hypothetical protein [Mycolicibacterium]OBJ95133.1 hypothetical protein A5638_21560 [Mycolicibacterium fortuitum]OBK67263.1 hypothetical protein A5654_16900 [Mycolicibacterium fortuitum]OMB95211.1 hypothetical protein A5746_01895 [Mycolicibacterium conceptionense]
MKRREPAEPAGGYLLNGKLYATEAEYLVAREKQHARRQRLLALIGAESGPRLFQVRAHRDS